MTILSNQHSAESAVVLMLTPVPGLGRNEYGNDINALVNNGSAYN